MGGHISIFSGSTEGISPVPFLISSSEHILCSFVAFAFLCDFSQNSHRKMTHRLQNETAFSSSSQFWQMGVTSLLSTCSCSKRTISTKRMAEKFDGSSSTTLGGDNSILALHNGHSRWRFDGSNLANLSDHPLRQPVQKEWRHGRILGSLKRSWQIAQVSSSFAFCQFLAILQFNAHAFGCGYDTYTIHAFGFACSLKTSGVLHAFRCIYMTKEVAMDRIRPIIRCAHQ